MHLLALQFIIDIFLLFLDVFGTVSNLLKHDLHHVHLADGQTSHFWKRLLLHLLVRGFLQFRELCLDICERLFGSFPIADYLSHVPGVEGQHWVGREVELVRGVNDPLFAWLWAREELLARLVQLFIRTGFGFGDLVDEVSWVATHLIMSIELAGELDVTVLAVVIMSSGAIVLREATRSVMRHKVFVQKVHIVGTCFLLCVLIVFGILHIA